MEEYSYQAVADIEADPGKTELHCALASGLQDLLAQRQAHELLPASEIHGRIIHPLPEHRHATVIGMALIAIVGAGGGYLESRGNLAAGSALLAGDILLGAQSVLLQVRKLVTKP